MSLSDEDRRRIDEEEYRKLARERLERTVRIEADIRTSGDQRIEVRGVGTEIYSDAKGAAKSVVTWLIVAAALLWTPISAIWFSEVFAEDSPLPNGYERIVRNIDHLPTWISVNALVIPVLIGGFVLARRRVRVK